MKNLLIKSVFQMILLLRLKNKQTYIFEINKIYIFYVLILFLNSKTTSRSKYIIIMVYGYLIYMVYLISKSKYIIYTFLEYKMYMIFKL